MTTRFLIDNKNNFHVLLKEQKNKLVLKKIKFLNKFTGAFGKYQNQEIEIIKCFDNEYTLISIDNNRKLISCCGNNLNIINEIQIPKNLDIKHVNILVDGSIIFLDDKNIGYISYGKINKQIFWCDLECIKSNGLKPFCELSTHKKVIKMVSGYLNTYLLVENNEIYGRGSNKSGQLLRDVSYSKYFIKIYQHTYIKNIYCGYFHIFLELEKKYVCFGDNTYGQLGIINNIRNPAELKTDIFKDIQPKLIECGGYHTLFYFKNGDLYSCGRNNEGQLGLNNLRNYSTPQFVLNNPSILSIKCFEYSSILYTNEGNIIVFGSNKNGKLGIKNLNIKKKLGPTMLNLNNSHYNNMCNIILGYGTRIKNRWNISNHKYYNSDLKSKVLLFYLILRRKRKYIIVPPKFIIYKIISYIL